MEHLGRNNDPFFGWGQKRHDALHPELPSSRTPGDGGQYEWRDLQPGRNPFRGRRLFFFSVLVVVLPRERGLLFPDFFVVVKSTHVFLHMYI